MKITHFRIIRYSETCQVKVAVNLYTVDEAGKQGIISASGFTDTDALLLSGIIQLPDGL